MDAQLAGGGALIAIVFREDCLQISALELTFRHIEGDSFPNHFDDEIVQQLSHRKVPLD